MRIGAHQIRLTFDLIDVSVTGQFFVNRTDDLVTVENTLIEGQIRISSGCRIGILIIPEINIFGPGSICRAFIQKQFVCT
ncbi:hypothetical protein D3C79_935360 [compost metagenome]